MCSLQNGPGSPKPYDYLLKFLLVGDSDVGKEELLSGMEDGATESPYPSTDGKGCRRVLIDQCWFMLHALSLSICTASLTSSSSFIIVVIFKYWVIFFYKIIYHYDLWENRLY